MRFSDLLAHGRMFVEWQEFDHPQFGAIEIGGFRHDTWRVPEGWMLEQECHRNAAFILFHASHLPQIRFGEPVVRQVRGKLREVYLPVVNERIRATTAALEAQ